MKNVTNISQFYGRQSLPINKKKKKKKIYKKVIKLIKTKKLKKWKKYSEKYPTKLSRTMITKSDKKKFIQKEKKLWWPMSAKSDT